MLLNLLNALQEMLLSESKLVQHGYYFLLLLFSVFVPKCLNLIFGLLFVLFDL